MAANKPAAPATLPAVIDHHVQVRPDAIAIDSPCGPWSYTGLAQRVRSAQARLAGAGLQPGQRVAWLGANHPGQLVLLFALARLGAMLLPLNFRLAAAEWQSLLARCTPVLLLHDADWAQAAHGLGQACGIPVLPVEALADAAGPGVGGDASAPGLPVLLVQTSGTTGGPKVAVHTQANLLANMAIAAQAQQMTARDRILTVLPLFHVGGLCIQTLPALHAGACVLLQPRFHAPTVLAAIAQQRPTLTLQVPATMQALQADPAWSGTDLSSLRAVWAGSSVIPAPLIEGFHARGVPVCNVYGTTETGPFSVALPPERARSHLGSCGWPAAGVEVSWGARHGDAAELLVRGPNVAAHYWPDLPAADGQGWFATGDLAQQAGDGSLRIVGRARDLIISGGENIHPAEVEQAVAAHAGVAECAAFGLPDARWGEVVALAVVRRPEAAHLTQEDLLAHLEGRLARYKWPRRWLWLEALPRTALGKVQRGDLRRVAGG